MALVVKNLLANEGNTMKHVFDCSLGWGDPLEKGMATRASILAWRQNERNIKFIRVGDAVKIVGQLKGEPTLNCCP